MSAPLRFPAEAGSSGTRADSADPLTTLSPEEENRYAELQLFAIECAREGNAEPLLAMLAAGLPPNLSDHRGNSLLMLACYHGHEDTARMLLSRGADVDRRNDRGQTPLGGVAFKGHTALAALLLDHGADIHADNGRGLTPIMFASLFGRMETVDLLESRGALRRRNAGWLAPTRWCVRLSRLVFRHARRWWPRRTVSPAPLKAA